MSGGEADICTRVAKRPAKAAILRPSFCRVGDSEFSTRKAVSKQTQPFLCFVWAGARFQLLVYKVVLKGAKGHPSSVRIFG